MTTKFHCYLQLLINRDLGTGFFLLPPPSCFAKQAKSGSGCRSCIGDIMSLGYEPSKGALPNTTAKSFLSFP